MIKGTPAELALALAFLDEEKTYEVKEIKKSRSLLQNNYIHLIFSAIAKEIGDEPKYVKELLKGYFLEEKMEGKSGKIITRIKSTSELNSKEITEFISNIRNWALHNIQMQIPDPDDLRFNQFCKEYKLN